MTNTIHDRRGLAPSPKCSLSVKYIRRDNIKDGAQYFVSNVYDMVDNILKNNEIELDKIIEVKLWKYVSGLKTIYFYAYAIDEKTPIKTLDELDEVCFSVWRRFNV